MVRRINTGAQAGNATQVAAVALQQGTTWGTAAAVGAGDGVAVTSEGIAGGQETLMREDLGFPFGSSHDPGAEMHRGPLNFDVYHGGGFGAIIAYWFGIAGLPVATGASNLHTMTLKQSLDAFATIVIGKRDGAKFWEYASAMATKFEISGAGAERLKGSVEFIANALDVNSSVNTTTQTNAVTVPTRRALAYSKTGLFRLNAQAGGALASPTDDQPIASFKISGDRGLTADMLIDGTVGCAQAAEEGQITVDLEVALRSYDADTWITAFKAGTEYKADLKFTSTFVPAGGDAMFIKFNLGRMVVSEQPQAPIAGRGRIPHVVKFRCFAPVTAPTGMTGLLTPIECFVNDERTTAYIA